MRGSLKLFVELILCQSLVLISTFLTVLQALHMESCGLTMPVTYKIRNKSQESKITVFSP